MYVQQKNAIKLFRTCVFENVVGLRHRAELGAACLYIKCADSSFPRTIREIAAAATDVSAKDVGKLCNRITQALQLQKGRVQADSLVNRLGSEMQLPFEVCQLAVDVCKLVHSAGLLEGTSPQIVAAASLALSVICRAPSGELQIEAVDALVKLKSYLQIIIEVCSCYSCYSCYSFVLLFVKDVEKLAGAALCSSGSIKKVYTQLVAMASDVLPNEFRSQNSANIATLPSKI